MKKFGLSVAGAATLLTSAALLIDYGHRRSSNKNAHPAELVIGIVGSVAGITMAVLGELELPSKKKIDELDLEGLLDDSDIDLMEDNISAVLGASAEQVARPEKLHHIELDEEASIEDFI